MAKIPDDPSAGRRTLLKGAAAAGLSSFLEPLPRLLAGTPAKRDLIRAENEKPGTTDWQLQNVHIDSKLRYRSRAVEGYCSCTSLCAGEKLQIMVSSDPASPFTIDIYRLGYYGGSGGRHLQRLGPFPGKIQPDPVVGEERLRECRWEPAVEFAIPSDWVSGVYVGKLTTERDHLQSYVIFIVRDDRGVTSCFSVRIRRGPPTTVGPISGALRRWTQRVVHRTQHARELGPSLCEILPGDRQPVVHGIRQLHVVGIPARVLDGATRI